MSFLHVFSRNPFEKPLWIPAQKIAGMAEHESHISYGIVRRGELLRELLKKSDLLVKEKVYPNRSKIVQEAAREKFIRIDKS